MTFQPMHFPGPNGEKWAHRVETFGTEQIVSEPQLRLASDPDFVKAMRGNAAVRISDYILEKAATFREIDEPQHDQRRYRWQFSVVLPDQGQNWFAEQVERERRAAAESAANAAAAILRDAAARYRHREGHCEHVIAAELGEQAAKIERSVPAMVVRGPWGIG